MLHVTIARVPAEGRTFAPVWDALRALGAVAREAGAHSTAFGALLHDDPLQCMKERGWTMPCACTAWVHDADGAEGVIPHKHADLLVGFVAPQGPASAAEPCGGGAVRCSLYIADRAIGSVVLRAGEFCFAHDARWVVPLVTCGLGGRARRVGRRHAVHQLSRLSFTDALGGVGLARRRRGRAGVRGRALQPRKL